jgi:hypothetical protein
MTYERDIDARVQAAMESGLTRPAIVCAIVEADANGDTADVAALKSLLEAWDREMATVRLVDYERGPRLKRTRVYVRGRLECTILDD